MSQHFTHFTFYYDFWGEKIVCVLLYTHEAFYIHTCSLQRVYS